MDKKTTFNEKLRSYSALAGATMATVAVSGQIVYTDIEPDIIIDEPGEFYDLDLNKDGNVDFVAEYLNEMIFGYTLNGNTYGQWAKGVFVNGEKQNNQTMGKSWGKGSIRSYVLDDSASVYGKFNSGTNKNFLRATFSKALNGVPFNDYNYNNGDFDSVVNKYVGLKFFVDGNPHHAWLRVDVIPNADDTQFELRLKDFAYNKIPSMPILAGVGKDIKTLAPPTNIVATDVANTFSAYDCEVSWVASTDDNVITEYGLIAVKSEKADGLTLDDMIKSEGGNSVSISPDGSPNYTERLELGMLDFDGDPVLMGRAYKILAYSLHTGGLYNASWSLSNEITLSESNEVATSILAEDIANNGNASDMQVSFDTAANESNVKEYRIIIVPSNQISSFDSTMAAGVSSANYTVVTPDGSNKQLILDATAKDIEGNSINQNNSYYAFVVSELKAGVGFRVSTPSNIIRLVIPAPKITEITAHDVEDAGNAYDIEIRYKSPVSDTLFNYVKFIVMPKGDVDGWSDDKIMNLSTAYSKYYNNYDTLGVMDTIRLYPYAITGDGREIEDGVLYQIYPFTEPRQATNVRTLGTPTEIMLTSPIIPVSEVLAVNIANNFIPTDWKIVAEMAQKESHVSEYRIIAVPMADAASFDLANAEAVISGNYVVVAPTGLRINQVMPAGLTDADGMAIDKGEQYKFFVLSIGNNKAKGNVLSEASNAISLEKASAIDEALTKQFKVYFNEDAIHFYLPGLTQKANVIMTSMTGATIYNGVLNIGQEVIHTGRMSSGIYIVNIISNEVSLTRKLLVK